eukprot:m.1025456 g.1025456  ORF g.1025456 m.1025456 type:complete len:312 (-) comp24105_c0_seq2:2428-3363(-)
MNWRMVTYGWKESTSNRLPGITFARFFSRRQQTWPHQMRRGIGCTSVAARFSQRRSGTTAPSPHGPKPRQRPPRCPRRRAPHASARVTSSVTSPMPQNPRGKLVRVQPETSKGCHHPRANGGGVSKKRPLSLQPRPRHPDVLQATWKRQTENMPTTRAMTLRPRARSPRNLRSRRRRQRTARPRTRKKEFLQRLHKQSGRRQQPPGCLIRPSSRRCRPRGEGGSCSGACRGGRTKCSGLRSSCRHRHSPQRKQRSVRHRCATKHRRARNDICISRAVLFVRNNKDVSIYRAVLILAAAARECFHRHLEWVQ